jgi:hypothetical protein
MDGEQSHLSAHTDRCSDPIITLIGIGVVTKCRRRLSLRNKDTTKVRSHFSFSAYDDPTSIINIYTSVALEGTRITSSDTRLLFTRLINTDAT